MRHSRFFPCVLVALSGLVLSACAGDADQQAGDAAPSVIATAAEASDEGAVEVAMLDAEGTDVGTVTLTPDGDGTRIEAEVDGLESGFHAFHIHDVGVCEPDAPDGPFTTATGHYVGEGAAHGEHDGDMPSLYVGEDGTASLSATLDTFTLDELSTDDGAAVMIHVGPDNYANIPDRYTSAEAAAAGPDDMTNSTGDAGDRAACGVIGASS